MRVDMWFPILALIIASLSPIAVGWYSHTLRRREVDDEKRRQKEDETHRNEVAGEAIKMARELVADSRKLKQETSQRIGEITCLFPNGNLTSAMRRQLTTAQQALSAMQ